MKSEIDNKMHSSGSKDLKLNPNLTSHQELYPMYEDPAFNIKIAQKQEFNEIYNQQHLALEELADAPKSDVFELNTQQLFIRNFLSKNTPYNNLLLYHGLGTGKTCTSIGVAMEKIRYMHQTNNRQKVIVVASPNVQENFKKEIFQESRLIYNHEEEWSINSCAGTALHAFINPINGNLSREKIINYINEFIKEWFDFVGYAKFSNMIQQSLQNKSIKEDFNDRLIIIDEIHNIRVGEDTKNKRIADSLVSLVTNTDHVQLLMLSATPMFNSFKEIIWLINLMNLNDNRPIMSYKDIFDTHGHFAVDKTNGDETGLQNFVRKITGYVSFVQGENPVFFPFRIFPTDFEKSKSILHSKYPTVQFDGSEISAPLKHIDLYTLKMENYQENVYEHIINYIRKSYNDTDSASLGYQLLQLPLNILNISYPNPYFDSLHKDKDTKFNRTLFVNSVGKSGFSRIFKDITQYPFEYNPEFVKEYGRIFESKKIGQYSSKIKSICNSVDETEGVSLIYSEKIFSGVLPMALALEEMGYSRHNKNNFLKNKKKKGLTYTLITGNQLYSPNNKKEIEACVDPENTNGEHVKVIIISRAGSEGIDLKYIRNIHIMEPWYNMNRQEQVIGRGIRNKSHISLPVEKRNCCIYMYGTLLSNKEESVDLYVYRLAEDKSIKIGRVSRVLKETAVDCLLHKKENTRYFKNEVSNIKQLLSNGDEIKYDIQKKSFSSTCDYMETCHIDCKVFNDKYSKISITDGEESNIHTYDKYHTVLNANDIIPRIKALFKDKYYYSKRDIIARICFNKQYPVHLIDYALKEIIENPLIYVYDRYDRRGSLVQVKDFYLYQPGEIENKHIFCLLYTSDAADE